MFFWGVLGKFWEGCFKRGGTWGVSRSLQLIRWILGGHGRYCLVWEFIHIYGRYCEVGGRWRWRFYDVMETLFWREMRGERAGC